MKRSYYLVTVTVLSFLVLLAAYQSVSAESSTEYAAAQSFRTGKQVSITSHVPDYVTSKSVIVGKVQLVGDNYFTVNEQAVYVSPGATGLQHDLVVGDEVRVVVVHSADGRLNAQTIVVTTGTASTISHGASVTGPDVEINDDNIGGHDGDGIGNHNGGDTGDHNGDDVGNHNGGDTGGQHGGDH